MTDKQSTKPKPVSPVKKVVAKKTAAPKKSKAPPKPKQPPPPKKQQPQQKVVSEKNLKYAAFKRPNTSQQDESEDEEDSSVKTTKKAVVPEKKKKRVSEKSIKYAAFKRPAALENDDEFETSDIVFEDGQDQDDDSDNEEEEPPTAKNKAQKASKPSKATKKNTPKKVAKKSPTVVNSKRKAAKSTKTPVRRVTKAKKSPFAKKTKTKKATPPKKESAKKFACSTCDKSYAWKGDLAKHVKKVHEVQNVPEVEMPMPSGSTKPKKVEEKKKKLPPPPPPPPKPTKKISRKKSLDDVRHVSQLEDLQSFTTKNRKKSIQSSSSVNTSSKHIFLKSYNFTKLFSLSKIWIHIDFNYCYFFPDMLGISQLKSKPKTITDMMNNDKILREFNTNHQDNVFKKNNKQKAEKSKHQTTASAIRTELFDSDSEQDISLMSSRTPITAFFNRNRTLDDNNDDEDADDENDANPENYQKTNAEPG